MPLHPEYLADPALLMQDAGWTPAPWQAHVLRSTHPRIAICCGRQMGKSLTTACKAIHRALTRSRTNIYLASRSQDQADELFAKIIDVYDRIGRPLRVIRQLVSEIWLSNRSRIVAFPNNPDTVRGYSDAGLLILDEASRISGAMIAAMMPMMMASKGNMIILSTPCGQTGYFYDTWSSSADWDRVSATAYECPHFDQSIVAQVARDLGPMMARQELGAEFLLSSESVFSSESIYAAFLSNVAGIRDF
jgi:hypothetical protein